MPYNYDNVLNSMIALFNSAIMVGWEQMMYYETRASK